MVGVVEKKPLVRRKMELTTNCHCEYLIKSLRAIQSHTAVWVRATSELTNKKRKFKLNIYGQSCTQDIKA